MIFKNTSKDCTNHSLCIVWPVTSICFYKYLLGIEQGSFSAKLFEFLNIILKVLPLFCASEYLWILVIQFLKNIEQGDHLNDTFNKDIKNLFKFFKHFFNKFLSKLSNAKISIGQLH